MQERDAAPVTRISREDALLWLNDRLGREAEVDIRADASDGSFCVASVRGALSHWTENVPPLIGGVGDALSEQLRGLYKVGGTDINIGDERLRHFGLRRFSLSDGRSGVELIIRFPGDVAYVSVTDTFELTPSLES